MQKNIEYPKNFHLNLALITSSMDKKIRKIFTLSEIIFFSILGLIIAVVAYLKSGIVDALSVVAFVILVLAIDKMIDLYKARKKNIEDKENL